MFNKKSFATKKSKSIKVKFDKFNQWSTKEDFSDITKTKTCFNFSIDQSSLSAGYGFKRLSLPSVPNGEEAEFEFNATDILGAWFFESYEKLTDQDKYYILFLDQNKKMHFFDVFNDKRVYPTNAVFNEVPVSAEFRINGDIDTMFFASPSDQTIGINRGGTQVFDNIPQFVSGCWHDKYLFLLTTGDKNKLMFSKQQINFWNDENVGEVELPDVRGGMTKLMSLNNTLYIFREYGITKLNLYSTKSEISTSHIYHSSAYIYPGSIAKSGDKIIFLTSDGLYSLENDNVTKLEFPMLEGVIARDNHLCCSECDNDRYFLACSCDFGDVADNEAEFVNNTLIVYDLHKKIFEFVRGVDIKNIAIIRTSKMQKVCATFRGENKAYIGELTHDGNFFGSQLHKVWSSAECDFEYPMQNKCITEIAIKPKNSGKIIITSEIDRFEREVPYSEKPQRIRTNVFGKSFSVVFEGENMPQISCPELSLKVFL